MLTIRHQPSTTHGLSTTNLPVLLNQSFRTQPALPIHWAGGGRFNATKVPRVSPLEHDNVVSPEREIIGAWRNVIPSFLRLKYILCMQMFKKHIYDYLCVIKHIESRTRLIGTTSFVFFGHPLHGLHRLYQTFALHPSAIRKKARDKWMPLPTHIDLQYITSNSNTIIDIHTRQMYLWGFNHSSKC